MNFILYSTVHYTIIYDNDNIKRYYTNRPSMYKLLELLNTHNISELCVLSKYVTEAVKLRNLIIY